MVQPELSLKLVISLTFHPPGKFNVTKILIFVVSVALLSGCSNRSAIKLGDGKDAANAAINLPRAIIESGKDSNCRNSPPEKKLTCHKAREAETKELADRIIKAKSREKSN